MKATSKRPSDFSFFLFFKKSRERARVNLPHKGFRVPPPQGTIKNKQISRGTTAGEAAAAVAAPVESS